VRSSSLGRFASSEVYDQCGWNRMRYRIFILASLRLATLRTIIVRSPAALLAWASGQALGRPLNDSSPVTVIQQRHRNSRAPRRHRPPSPFSAESIGRQRATAGGPCTTGPIIAARLRVNSITEHDGSRSFDRAPLMRFCPLQHSLAALRCPGLPATGQSRFGVSCDRPHCADSRSYLRPCGLSHCGSYRGDARVMDDPE
jgi:hypothetical protein